MAKREEDCKVKVVAPPEEHLVDTYCIGAYYDIELERNVYYGEHLSMNEKRANALAEKGLVRVL